ncbi:site-specific integrase [Klebsiella electrica]
MDSVTFHSWLERYEKIIAARGLKQKTLIDYASKLRSIKERVQDIPIAEITTRQIAMILNDYANEGKPASCPDSISLVNHQAFMSCVACRQGCTGNKLETVLRSIY